MKIKRKVQFGDRQRGAKRKRPPEEEASEPAGRVPRVARLMALAIHFDELLRSGAVRDQAELAGLCGVTRARVTQIMNLLHLAPGIQEQILFMPETRAGRDRVHEAGLRAVAAEVEWGRQRASWCSRLNC